jgi:hypothetical protein
MIKINRQNAMRRMNYNEVGEHAKSFPMFIAFVFLSPFIMMLLSTLLTMILSIFQQNTQVLLSPQDVTGLRVYLNGELTQLQNISSLSIIVDGVPKSLSQCLADQRADVVNAIVDATSHGYTDLVNKLNNELSIIDKLSNYLNGDMSTDISQLHDILNSLQPGQIN